MSQIKVTRIHHIGFVVADLEETLRAWEGLFGVKAETKENPELQVRFGSMVIGDVKFVFNASTSPGSRWDTFLTQNGEGIEHIALEVSDINEACDAAKSLGLEVRFAAHKLMHDTMSNFVEKDRLHGTTIELMEPVKVGT